MKPFRVTGEELMRRYAEAVQVRVVEKNGKLKMRMVSSNQILSGSIGGKSQKRKREMRKGLSKKELVYLDESLDYCKLGNEQVTGKQCNATSAGPDSCDNLCCGRGYYKKMRKVEEKCKTLNSYAKLMIF